MWDFLKKDDPKQISILISSTLEEKKLFPMFRIIPSQDDVLAGSPSLGMERLLSASII